MSLHAWFATDEVEVVPGATLKLFLRVQNTDDHDESVALVPAGPASTWLQLPAGEIEVPAGQIVSITIDLTPPELPTTNAGPTWCSAAWTPDTKSAATASVTSSSGTWASRAWTRTWRARKRPW